VGFPQYLCFVEAGHDDGQQGLHTILILKVNAMGHERAGDPMVRAFDCTSGSIPRAAEASVVVQVEARLHSAGRAAA
jgi:hypothetical protein